QVGSIEGKVTAYQGTVDQQRKTLEQQLETNRHDAAQTIQDKDSQIIQLKKELDIANRRIQDLTPTAKANAGGPHPSLQPDGQIGTVVNEEGTVYIDRGRRDHIVAGMTFEVFDKSTGVTKGELNPRELRGKATIEVIAINDNSSVCRIVRLGRNKTLV